MSWNEIVYAVLLSLILLGFLAELLPLLANRRKRSENKKSSTDEGR